MNYAEIWHCNRHDYRYPMLLEFNVIVVDVKKIIILCCVAFAIFIGITVLICWLLNRNRKNKIKFVNKKFTEDKDDERN